MYKTRMDKNQIPIVWTAIITPFLENGAIDFTSLEHLVRMQEKFGNGILFLGSTGESLNLTNLEKKQVIDWVQNREFTVPTMCGVGGFCLDSTLSWIKAINEYKFDAYLLVTPPYAKPGAQGQLAWFTKLMDVSQKPCVLYNVPGRTACSLHRTALRELAKHKNLLGIKESSGSIDEFIAYKQTLPNHAVYCGDDIMMPHFAKEGACGLVSVASNAWPEQVQNYTQKCLNQTFDDFDLWKQACENLFTTSNPVPIKHLLHKRGLIKTSLVKAPLSHLDMGDDTDLIKYDQKIVLWV
ncbi:MAG: 4-hydroxy-tetrahydrodipicolinate synthase [Bdellovibrionales bacterium]|nr:4-hydroxy-tetrahydrodipicolinate synthase [Bdellovibrionales bacterium]